MNLELLSEPATYISLLTLTALEIVLGIDNIIFISILTGKLPPEHQARARRIGLGLALFMRIALLLAISWVLGITAPLFEVFNQEISGRDLILIGGGLFLLGKATHEIYGNLEVTHDERLPAAGAASFGLIIAQILVLDAVFSLDSVITAVGLAQHVAIMVVAMVIAVVVMLILAGPISGFVHRHPSLKILGLAFLILIGVVLVADGLGQHLSKGYVYFAMAFALGIELINMRMRRRQAPVALHHPFEADQRPETGAAPG